MNFGENELIIMVKHVTVPPVLHEVFFIGGDLKGSNIKQQFLPISEKTKIIVDVDLKLNLKKKIPRLFGKNKFEQDYERILEAFTKILDS